MTLLEALVALVILGLSGVGFLESFQGAARATANAEDWVAAVGEAESIMEATKLGAGARDFAAGPGAASGSVEVEPWSSVPGVDVVTVTVPLPGGGTFVLRRLARDR